MKLLDLLTLDLRRAKTDAGVYVSRPVLNFAEWQAWMDRHAVPNPIPDLHVTVIYSINDVKIPLNTDPYVIYVKDSAFLLFGPDEDTLVIAFDDWRMWDRNWAYQRAGAVSRYPTFRAHMSLTKDMGDWELPDSALSDVPEHIVLGAEVRAPLKQDAPADDVDPEGGDEGDDATLIVVIEIAASAAKAALDSTSDLVLSPVDKAALRDIAGGKKITKAVAKRLAATDWAPAEIKALAGAKVRKTLAFDVDSVPGRQSKQVELTVQSVRKALGDKVKDVMKMDDDRHLIWGIANVSTVDGQPFIDHHGDTFTTRALEEFAMDLVRGGRAGKVDHAGEPVNEIVQALVLSEELQKALGCDLGFEPLVICTHVPDAALWDEVKTGDWEFSIAGSFYYYEEAAA